MIQEIAHLWRRLISQEQEQIEGKAVFKVELKQFGASSLYFFWYEGRVATESTPLDGIICDEIRLTDIMKLETIQKRLLGSQLKLERYTSTWGYPGDSVDLLFRQTNQNQFYTRCERCNHDFVMWREFEKMGCIGERKVEGKPEYYYRCPKCGGEILDTNKGVWVPEQEGVDFVGYHVHGMLAPHRTGNQLWRRYKEAKNIKEFWNSDIGITYLDRTKQLVTKEVLDNCMDTNMQWDANGRNCYMGVDVQMEFLAVVIKRMLEGEIAKLSYICYLYGTDDAPFRQLHQLMNTFDVNVCVLDGMSPRASEVREFCKAWRGRAFYATYHTEPTLVKWYDKILRKPDEKTTREVRELDKYRVSIQKDLMLEFSLKRYVNRGNVIPHGGSLIHRVRVKDIPYKERLNLTGKSFEDMVPVATCMTLFYPHLQSYVKEEFPEILQVEVGGSKQPVKTGNVNYRFVTKGIDPHFADSDMFANVALSRRYFRIVEA